MQIAEIASADCPDNCERISTGALMSARNRMAIATTIGVTTSDTCCPVNLIAR